MPRFRVRAVDRAGSLIVTVSEAVNADRLRSSLRDRGWTVLSIKSMPGERYRQWRLRRLANGTGVVLVRQLGELLQVGVPVTVALEEVRQLAPAGPLALAWGRVCRAVDQGDSLVDAFTANRGLFLDRHLALMSVGLSQPRLAVALLDIGAELSWRADLVQRLRLAASYPIFTAVTLLAVSAFFLLQVVPALKPILDPVKDELPWVTRKILALSTPAMQTNASWLQLQGLITTLIVLIVLIVCCLVVSKFLHLNASALRTFFLSRGLYQRWVWPFSVAIHARAVRLMLKQGMPLPEAVGQAAFAAGIWGTRPVWLDVTAGVERDGLLSNAIKRAKVLPNLYESLIKVGERHNTLEGSLEMCAKLYDERITQKLDHLSSMIGPILLLFVGAVMACGFAWIVVPVYDAISVQGSL